MLHRLVLVGAAMLLLACALSACGGGTDATPVPDPQTETRIILPSGGGAIFPAGAFAGATEVDVNEELTGAQQAQAGFPANSGALLGATTVKVPAGVALNTNIEVRIALSTAQATNLGVALHHVTVGQQVGATDLDYPPSTLWNLQGADQIA